MALFLSSDHHFWHANVIKYCGRPYFNVEQMNEDLVYRHNEVVGPEDRFICLGDFSFAGRSVELYSSRLNGKKELVPGNHDPIHPYNKHQKKATKQGKPDEWQKFYERLGWKVHPIVTTLEVPGLATFNLCHMPYDTGTFDARYVDFIAKDDGRWLLCGHVHEKWIKRGRMINVGVDVHDYKPVSIERIAQIMDTPGDF